MREFTRTFARKIVAALSCGASVHLGVLVRPDVLRSPGLLVFQSRAATRAGASRPSANDTDRSSARERIFATGTTRSRATGQPLAVTTQSTAAPTSCL